MVWFPVIFLAAFLVILLKWVPRALLVFAGTPLLRICGVTLFVASAFVALTAGLGGITLAAGVDKFPADWLIGTPFSSYLIPGLILTVVVGGSAAVAAVATLRRPEAGALTSTLAGAVLLGWLAGERLILPPAAFSPQFWWLEAIYIAAGLMMVVPGLTVLWVERLRITMPRKMSLKSRLILRSSLGLILFAAMLFIPAGSLKFWQGWAFMPLFFIPIIYSFLYFYKHDPQLLERRLQRKEKITEQKLLMRLFKLVFFAAFLLPGLDYRLGWSRASLGAVPLWLTLLSQALVLGGLLLVVWVLKVNSFASSTIQVEASQKVISTGPYRMVRHPMYVGFLVIMLSAPLALGSYFALPAFVLFIPFLVFRLLNEEKVLRQELPGYPEYCLRTRFRLIPYLW